MKTRKEFRIIQDPDPPNPRKEFENLGKMVCFHRHYDLGDKHDFSSPDELLAFLKREKPFWRWLFLLDHSGLCLRTSRFECDPGGWDTSRIGVIYVDKRQVREEWKVKRISPKLRATIYRNIECEVETYSKYLEGDVWGFELVEIEEDDDKTEHTIDSYWGFFGGDPKENGMVECIGKEDQSLLDNPIYWRGR